MKQVLALLLSVLMLTALLPLSVWAEEDELLPIAAETAPEIPAEPEQPDTPCAEPEADPVTDPEEEPAPADTPAEDPSAPAEPEQTDEAPAEVLPDEPAEPEEEREPVPEAEEEPDTPEEEPPAPTVTVLPLQDAAIENGAATLVCRASVNAEDILLRYQWQQLDAGSVYENEFARGEAWTDMPGETDASLRFTDIDEQLYTASYADMLFRCVVRTDDDTELSTEARLLPDPAWAEAPGELPEEEQPEEELPGGDGYTLMADMPFTVYVRVTPEGAGTVTGNRNSYTEEETASLTVSLEPGFLLTAWYTDAEQMQQSGVLTSGRTYTFSPAAVYRDYSKAANNNVYLEVRCRVCDHESYPVSICQEYLYDKQYHWKKACSGCLAILDREAHTDDDHDGRCDVCDVEVPIAHGTCGETVTWALYASGRFTVSGTGAMADYSDDNRFPWLDCKIKITSVVIEQGVTSIGSKTFVDCVSVNSVTIPESVTSIGSGAFMGCTKLTSVTIPGSVTGIGANTFEGCTDLTSVTLPAGLTSIGANAFSDCSALSSIILPSGLTSLGANAFGDCGSLASVNIPAGLTSFGEGVFLNCQSLETAGPDDEDYNIRFSWTDSIPAGAFKGDNKLTSVTLPVDFNGLGDYAFKDCSELCAITLPERVTSFGIGVFSGCTALETAGPDDGDYNIRFSWTDTVPAHALDEHHELVSVTIPEGITAISDYAFNNCNSLTSVTIPNSVTHIGQFAFSGCSSLTDVTYSGTMPQWQALLNGLDGKSTAALSGADVQYTQPNSGTCGEDLAWEYSGSELIITGTGEMDDYGATAADTPPWYDSRAAITAVTVSDGVTGIGSYAFRNFTALTDITVPKSLLRIGRYAFSGCAALADIRYYGTPEQWSDIVTHLPDGNAPLLSAQTHCLGGGTCGEHLTWHIEAGTLSVSGSGAMYDYTPGEAPWYPRRADITAVDLSGFEGLTIGSYALYGLSKIPSLSLPDSVTAIGAGAFSGCSALVSVTVPGSVTSVGVNVFSGALKLTSVSPLTGNCCIRYGWTEKIPANAFSGCASLKTAFLPDTLVYIGENAFANSYFLKTVCFGGTEEQWNAIELDSGNKCLEDAEILYTAFSGSCGENVTWTLSTDGTLTISGHGAMTDLGSVEEQPWAEYYGSVKAVVITEGVTHIGVGMFAYDTSLASVRIPRSVTSISVSAFQNCTALADVYYAGTETEWAEIDINVSNEHLTTGATRHYEGQGSFFGFTWTVDRAGTLTITGRGSMPDFGNDASPWYLKSAEIRSVVFNCEISNIGDHAFEKLPNLTSVVIPNGVTKIGFEAFRGDTGLVSVVIPDSVTEIDHYVFTDCTSLTSVTLPGSIENLGTNMFDGCTSLRSAALMNGIRNVEANMFSNCTSLTSVSLPSSVEEISHYAFSNCTSLSSVALPLGLISMGRNTFEYCISLQSVAIPDYISVIPDEGFLGCSSLRSVTFPETSLTKIGNDAFNGCSSLTSVTIPDSVTEVGGSAFFNCTSLSSVALPAGLKRIREYTFNNCRILPSIELPAGLERMDDCAFMGCVKLTSLTLPAGLASTGQGVFSHCDGLTSVTIPGSLEQIGVLMFAGCQGLTSVTIRPGVTHIGNSSFTDCTKLNVITIPGSVTRVEKKAFSNCNELATVIYTGSHWPAVSIGEHNECLTSAYVYTAPDITYLDILDEGGTDLTGTVLTVERGAVKTKQLIAAAVPARTAGVTWSSSAPAVASVDQKGLVTFLAPGTAVITAAANDEGGVSASVTFTVYEGDTAITLSESYLLLQPGDTVPLTATVCPSGLTVTWESTDMAFATVSAEGTVTAVEQGTAYINASVSIGGTVYTACCRVDVAAPEPPVSEQVSSVQLITASASVYVLRTEEFPTVTVLPVLAQNLSDAADDGAQDGPAIEEARFELAAANEFFTLSVKDDRTLEIRPNAAAIEAIGSKSLKTSYTSKLIVTLDGTEYTTPSSLRLSVKKNAPTVKGKALTCNSLMPEAPVSLLFTGATVIGVEPDTEAAARAKKSAVPEWMTLDSEAQTVSLVPGAAYASKGTLYLSLTLQGWAVPVSVKVPVTVKKTAPKLSFSEKSVTLLEGTPDRALVKYTVTPDAYADATRFPVTLDKLEVLSGKKYVEIENYTWLYCDLPEPGALLLRAPVPAADIKPHTYRLTLGCCGSSTVYTVKTLVFTTEPKLSVKSTGTINTMVADSRTVLTVTPKNFHADIGERYSLEKIQQYKGNARVNEYEGAAIAELFSVASNGNEFTLTEASPGSIPAGYTYKAVLGVDMDGNGTADGHITAPLKITFAKTAPKITVTAKASGSIDVTRPGSAIILTYAVNNWFGPRESSPVIYKKEGVRYRELVPGTDDIPFRISASGGVFTLTAGEDLRDATGSYYAAVRVHVNGTDVLSTRVKLAVKKGAVKMQSSISSAEFYRNDRFSRAVFTLTPPDGVTVESIQLDAAAEKKFALTPLGGGTYSLEYLNHTLPASFRGSTVKLSVFVNGCEKAVATVSIRISYK